MIEERERGGNERKRHGGGRCYTGSQGLGHLLTLLAHTMYIKPGFITQGEDGKGKGGDLKKGDGVRRGEEEGRGKGLAGSVRDFHGWSLTLLESIFVTLFDILC